MPAATIPALPIQSLQALFENLDQDDRDGDALLSAVRTQMKLLIEMGLQLDRTAQLGRAAYQRHPHGKPSRNGYYPRDLETGWGLLRALMVPRLRVGSRSVPLEQTLFARYRRRRGEVERFVRARFFAGVSTRGVGEVLEVLLGFAPSASAVSRMVAALDAEVKRYHDRPLEDRFVYLFLDGLTVTLREAPAARKRLVLVAYGITADGKRCLLDLRVAASEREAEWDRFLQSLQARGRAGKALRLIITDGGAGLRAAVQACYPDVPRQLCWAHKLRNVADGCRKRHQPACLQEARPLYQAGSRSEALTRWKEWSARWEAVEPRAVACLARDLEAQGLACSEKRVARLMRLAHLKATLPTRGVVTTDSHHALPVAENRLDRQFEVETPDTRWTGDIPYVWTG